MPGGPCYDEDFFAWTQYQAEVLRTMEVADQKFDRENLAEEVECLGRTQLHEVWSRVRRILNNFLLLTHGPQDRSRYGLKGEIIEARCEIEDRISPTIWMLTQSQLIELYERARHAAEIRLDGDPATADLPVECPYSLEEILLDDWYPESAEEAK